MTISTKEAWNKLFVELEIKNNINAHGVFYLQADRIKAITQKEPRLMCKFDHRESRPAILQENNYTILSVKNGHYAIVDADGYADIQTEDVLHPFYWPKLGQLQTLPLGFRSESQVIDAVYASGIFEDFIGENELVLTVRGRLRSKRFDFVMNTPKGELSFEIDGVQVEVDAGYEGDQVYLIETKMGETENFHMRQLFYPYRMWQAEGVTKNIIPIFLSYYNGIVSLTQYKFTNDAYYDSYQVVKSKQYTFETDPVANSLVEILDCIIFAQTTETSGAPPFPQANDLRKVRDVIDLIYCEINTKDTIAAYWDLEPRQGDYYANAAAYLGYIEKVRGSWVLTEKGLNYVSLPTSKRKRAFILSILKRTVFYVLTKKMIETSSVPERNVIKDVILEYININEVTANRRASTVKSWLVFIRNYFS
jgi:hypothetical protein